jgi:hypothetical protein
MWRSLPPPWPLGSFQDIPQESGIAIQNLSSVCGRGALYSLPIHLIFFFRLFWHNHWPICHTQNNFSVKFSWKTDEKIGNQSSAALLFFNISYYLLKGLATLNQFQVKFALDVVCPRHYFFFFLKELNNFFKFICFLYFCWMFEPPWWLAK